MKELIEIQHSLNAPKSRRNNFGNYNYRNAEDIMKAAKPILKELNCILILSDEVKEIGSAYTYNTQVTKNGQSNATAYNGTRIYVETTATLINSAGEKISVKASAREEVAKAGMDAAQITGAASSYARKYALNGLFAIDDGVDADQLNNNAQYTQQQGQSPHPVQAPPAQTQQEIFNAYVKPAIEQAQTAEDLTRIYNDYKDLQTMSGFMSALTARRKALGIKNKNES